MSSFFGLLADCACEREVLSVCCACEGAVSFGPSERWVLSGHERGVLSGCCERGAPSGCCEGGLRLDVRGGFRLVVVRGGFRLAVRGRFHLVILRGEFCLVVMRGGLITLNRLENLSLDMAIIKTQNRCQGIKSTMSMNIVNNLHNTS